MAMNIEIFEEDGDNTLTIDEQYAEHTIDVYPDLKTYKSSMRMKDDVYYRTEQFQYRIKTDPLKVETRLTERVDEPPERYSVKDGVVLESDILKERGNFMTSMTKEYIDGLKKDVEWHEDWVGNPVSMYILSKHPDMITPEDYRRHLRKLSEKIKNATLRVEKALESDEMGLQVTDEWTESGRTIWCSKEKQDAMSEEESSKAIEHQKKLHEKFFDENSKEYIGISEGEFRSSVDMLKNIEVFLNKNDTPTKKAEDTKTSFGIKFGAFVLQWVWLFFVVSVSLWLLSLIVTIVQYNITFAFVASGILAFFLTLLRGNESV